MPSKSNVTHSNIPKLKYLAAYSDQIKMQINTMIEDKTLDQYLLKKYPTTHDMNNDKVLRSYVMSLKNQYIPITLQDADLNT